MSESPTGRTNQKHLLTKRWLLLNVLLLTGGGPTQPNYPVEELSRRAGDMYFRLRGNQGTSPHVALILIDDASLERYGRWPWKTLLAGAGGEGCQRRAPKALGLDIFAFGTEDETNDGELAKALKDSGNAVLVSKISSSPQATIWVEPLPSSRKTLLRSGTHKLLWGLTAFAGASPSGSCLSMGHGGRCAGSCARC